VNGRYKRHIKVNYKLLFLTQTAYAASDKYV